MQLTSPLRSAPSIRVGGVLQVHSGHFSQKDHCWLRKLCKPDNMSQFSPSGCPLQSTVFYGSRGGSPETLPLRLETPKKGESYENFLISQFEGKKTKFLARRRGGGGGAELRWKLSQSLKLRYHKLIRTHPLHYKIGGCCYVPYLGGAQSEIWGGGVRALWYPWLKL